MRIGVDAVCWENKRGFGRFTRELLEALLEIDKINDYVFFVDRGTSGDAFPPRVQKIAAETQASPLAAASANGRRSFADLWAMSRAVLRQRIDVFFFPAVYTYFPVFNRTKIVVTVHDVIADHQPKLIFPNAKLKFFWKLKQNAAVRQADLVLTVSEHSKQQIRKYFKLPESSLRVVTEAARPIFRALPECNETNGVLAHYGLTPNEPFLLYVGGISPHKNLTTLIDAFKQIGRNHSPVKLVLVGDYKSDPFFSAYPSLKKQISELNLSERVIFTGFVPDADLVCLYNAAEALVFPSLEEGFGLPAIEAMSCGTPVAASNSSSLPEVLGDAAVYFDPRNAQNMAAAIEQILNDGNLQQSMRRVGLARAKQFTWKKAAQETLNIFDELIRF